MYVTSARLAMVEILRPKLQLTMQERHCFKVRKHSSASKYVSTALLPGDGELPRPRPLGTLSSNLHLPQHPQYERERNASKWAFCIAKDAHTIAARTTRNLVYGVEYYLHLLPVDRQTRPTYPPCAIPTADNLPADFLILSHARPRVHRFGFALLRYLSIWG